MRDKLFVVVKHAPQNWVNIGLDDGLARNRRQAFYQNKCWLITCKVIGNHEKVELLLHFKYFHARKAYLNEIGKNIRLIAPPKTIQWVDIWLDILYVSDISISVSDHLALHVIVPTFLSGETKAITNPRHVIFILRLTTMTHGKEMANTSGAPFTNMVQL